MGPSGALIHDFKRHEDDLLVRADERARRNRERLSVLHGFLTHGGRGENFNLIGFPVL
jgi:hypothetical protein